VKKPENKGEQVRKIKNEFLHPVSRMYFWHHKSLLEYFPVLRLRDRTFYKITLPEMKKIITAL
jgi:hypothetical protein